MQLRGKRLRRRFLRNARSEPRAYPKAICKRQTTTRLRKKIEQTRLIQLHGYGLVAGKPGKFGEGTMAKKVYIEQMTRAIEQAHQCQAAWIATGLVREVSSGWEGDVETFGLIGHPKAKRAFAWREKGRYTIVLEIPPVDSAKMAVKMAMFPDGATKNGQR